MLLHGFILSNTASTKPGAIQTATKQDSASKVAWDGDHHFVVLRVGTSQWWVADPWPHNSFVIPWTQCNFMRERILNHTQMRVVTPVLHSYGMLFNQAELNRSHERSIRYIPFTPGDGAFTYGHNWGQRHNLVLDQDNQPIPASQDAIDAMAGFQGPGENFDFATLGNDQTISLAANATTWGPV